jgi:hypothetical protein
VKKKKKKRAPNFSLMRHFATNSQIQMYGECKPCDKGECYSSLSLSLSLSLLPTIEAIPTDLFPSLSLMVATLACFSRKALGGSMAPPTSFSFKACLPLKHLRKSWKRQIISNRNVNIGQNYQNRLKWLKHTETEWNLKRDGK